MATSILAEDSLGISHTKLSWPFSAFRGMSCQGEMLCPVSDNYISPKSW